MKLLERIAKQSVTTMIRLACILAVAGLTLMMISVLIPRPLMVIGAMSLGHPLGIGAFLCYLTAVVLDTASRERSAPPNDENHSAGRRDESETPSARG